MNYTENVKIEKIKKMKNYIEKVKSFTFGSILNCDLATTYGEVSTIIQKNVKVRKKTLKFF